jgi:hypothetical protein
MAEFKLGRLRFVWKGTWAGTTSYVKDDVIKYGGTSYVCKAAHISNSDFNIDFTASRWEIMVSGQKWETNPWATSTTYKLNDLVKYGGNVYICTANHVSDSDATGGFYVDDTANKWDLFVSGNDWKGNWTYSTYYKKGDLVKYNGLNYICLTGHESKSGSYVGEFVNNVRIAQGGGGYSLASVVTFSSPQLPGGITAQGSITLGGPDGGVITGFTIDDSGTGYTTPPSITVTGGGGASFIVSISTTFVDGLELDADKWQIFSEGFSWRGDWNGSQDPQLRSATAYSVNDVVKFGASLYICRLPHTSSQTSFNESNWTTFVEGLEFEDNWSALTEYQQGDIVTYGGYSYVAAVRNTASIPPTSPNNWQLLTTGFNNRARYSEIQSYKVGDLVQYGGNTYVAIYEVSVGETPYTTTNKWEKVTDGFRWLADWSLTPAELTYKIGDIVKYLASSYICINEHIPSDAGTTLTATATNATTDAVTVNDTSALNLNQPIVFSGTSFGNITAGTTYYVLEILDGTRLKLTAELNGTVVKQLADATGLLTGTYTTRPDQDVGVFWNSFAEGDANNVLIRRGDLVTRNAIQNIRLPKGQTGTFLKAGEQDLTWGLVGEVPRVFYVSTDGIDSPTRGTTLTDPWKTIKYACDYVRTVVIPGINTPTVINVKTGVYTEVFPISIPKFTSLVGDELRMSIVEPTPETSGNDKFYMRDSTTIRNFTFRGATGANLPNGTTSTYTTPNQYGTQRPTGGSWVSLDPGTGPNDESVWVGQRSPYMQNITLFGDYCVGQKIDGSLHNGGNKSLTSNDFTTILSNGIGAWASGDGRAELVSVFTYYSYIGYLCENGGVIRATNGNNSYGSYGSVSEGVNPSEISRTSNVDNRRLGALVDRVQTDGENQVLYLEYINAGETYSTAEYGFSGSGTFNSIVATPVIRDGGVTEVSTINAGENYSSVTNNAQAGSNIDIRLGAADIALTNGYNGQRILIIDGTGSGQYAYITSFDGGSKLATLGMETFTPLQLIETATSTNIITVNDAETLSVDMPFTLTGTAFGGLATSTQYYVKAITNAGTLAGVVIADSGGNFTCTANTLVEGQRVTISGTKGGGGTIPSYSNPTTYYIINTNGTTSFQLSETKGGPAISTGAGTPTGLTYTLGSIKFTAYTDTSLKTAVSLASGTGSMLLHKSGWDTVISDITETVTAATQANPVQITTSVPHAYFSGMEVTFSSVVGMTQLNGNTYFVNKTGASTFTLYSDFALTTPIDGTGFTAYSGGGSIVGKQHTPLFLNTTTRYVVEPRVVVSTGAGASATALQTQGINTVGITLGGGGYTVAPDVIISGDGTETGGFGAVASTTIAGEVDTVIIQSKGSGYTTEPTLTFVGGGLENNSLNHATAHATITNTIKTVEVTSGGAGYTTPPSVTATGTGGSGAIIAAQISQVVGTVTLSGGLNSGGAGYTAPPSVEFVGGEPLVFAQGVAVLSAEVASITIQEGGSGYAPGNTTVSVIGGGGSNCTATPVIDFGSYSAGVTPGVITSIEINTAGSGFSTPPQVIITGAGIDASATANIIGAVTSVDITVPGRGYTTTPTIVFSGGSGAGARGTVSLTGSIIGLTVVDGGRGWSGIPTLSFSGGGGSSAAAEVTSMDSVLDTVIIDTPGTGYTSNPAISVTGGILIYNQAKCSRDVGLMIDAVTSDMVFNSNYMSVKAGISYLRSYANVVIDAQKEETLAAITKVRDLTLARTSNTTATSRITTLFGHITNIISNGLASVPTLVYTHPANTVSGVLQAADILVANREFIQEEITAWINVQITGGSGVWAGFTYDEATCARDVGYIVDAMIYDLLYGGNSQTVDVALSYFYGGVIQAEQSQSVLAYGRLKEILQQIVQNTSVTASSGNTATQDTSITPSGSFTAATTLADLTDILIDVVTNGTDAAPTIIIPSYGNGSTALATVRAALQTAKPAIQSQTIDYINQFLTGTSAVLRSRIDGVVQTITVSDPGGNFDTDPLITFVNGNQFKSAVAGNRYYSNESARIAIGLSQQTQTLAGIDRLREVARAVAQNSAPAQLYQTAVSRTTGSAGPSGIQNAVDVWSRAVYYTIQNGPELANAPFLLRANRSFIREEVMAFWNANYPGIATATWSRDVGLLVDAIASDMENVGVNYTLSSAINAVFLGTARTTNLVAATTGIEFVRDMAVDIIQNIIVTPLTGITITATASVTDLITTASTASLTEGDAVIFTGTTFGGLSANTVYYVIAVNSGTFQVSTVLGGDSVVLTSASGSMTLSKQYVDANVTLESNALTAIPNLFNYTKDIISTTVANSTTFAAVAGLINNNKSFIKAEVIAYINTTFVDFDYDQTLCARDVGFIVDAMVYDLKFAVDNHPTVTSTTTGVVSDIVVSNSGLGYGAGTTVTVVGGGASVNATATIQYNNNTGAITGFTMTNKGSGYSSTPSVTITPDAGSGALIRAKIVGGAVNSMTVIRPGSGYTAGPNLTLVDANNTSEASFAVRTADGVLDQPRFTSRGTGFTTADCLVNGDGYADISQVGQYVYVNNLTNVPTPGANIQFSTNPLQYYKLVTIRDVQGPTGIIGARQILLDNKEFIQYEVISYLNNFAYNSTKCGRDLAFIISAVADDFTYGGNSRLLAILYQHRRGTFALFEQQRMQTAFALEQLQLELNTLLSESPTSQIAVANKLNFLIEWVKNKEVFQALPALVMPNGIYDAEDDRAKNVLLTNETFIRNQVAAWMVNNSKINGFNQTTIKNEIGQIVRSVAYDLTYLGNTQVVEFASSYYIDGVLTIPGVPGTSAAAKSDFLDMLTYMDTLLQDVVLNENIIQESGNTTAQNTSGFPGDSASQGRINTLIGNFSSIVANGFAGSGVIITNSNFTNFNTTKRTLVNNNATALKDAVIQWIEDTFVDFTYDNDMCFRDVGLIVQSIADDIYGDVAKSVEAGQRYFAATATVVMNEQKPQTIAAIQQIDYITQLLIANQTYTRTQTNAFQVRYPAITNGTEAGPQLSETLRIIRRIIENGSVYDTVKQLLLDNKEYIKAEVVAFVSASYENLDYSIELCARDIGLIVDAICYDIYGGKSRSREAGLRYYQSASSLRAITGDQYGPTVAALEYANDVMQAILSDTDPAIKFQETVQRTSNSAIVFDAGRLLIGQNVSTFIDTILEVINGGPSVLPPGRYSARLQVSPPLSITTAPAHNTAMVIRSKYSQVRLTGHDFLNIGTGSKNDTNYPGIPLNAPNQNREITEVGGGRVFYTSTDQDGNFRVGSLFKVEQSTGIATLNADAFNLSGLNELTLGGVSLGSGGATVNEFSTDGTFFANSDRIVPTQKAIKTYIQSALGSGGGNIAVNAVTAGDVFITGKEIDTVGGLQISLISNNGVAITSPLSSTDTLTGALTVTGGVGVLENLNVGGTATIAGNLTISSSGAIKVATGGTGTRPGGAPGLFRFNTDTTRFEGHNGTAWTDVSGANPWSAKSSNYVAVNGDRLLVNTSSQPVTITLPANPAIGDTVRFVDAAGTFDINNLNIARNSQLIMGDADNMAVANKNAAFTLIYYNATYGWRLGEA